MAQGDRVIATARDVSKIQDLEQQYPLTNCSIHFRISYKTGHILGVSLLCHEAGEVISTVQMVMQAQMSYTVLRDGVLTHPTMTEGLNLLFSKL